MGRIVLGFVLGLLVASPSVEAIRIPKPPTITEWTPSALAQLNIWLESVWQVLNGRYELDETTVNPNGARQGRRNELIQYTTGGNTKICVNTSTAPGGTTWRCSANAFTAP